MSLTLYVADNCHQCAQVSEWVSENSDLRILNVDKGEGNPPIPTFIFPALFDGDGLKAYGEDIIPLLKRILQLS